jgi:catechol 2,3-dioxygenase-like lactoylglutathione lyase family enzyme
MSRTEMAPAQARVASASDFKLEVVVLPVTDVDRAKRFYTALGWREDADFATSDDFRVVQVTPPGSAASVIFGTGVTSAAPGSVEDLQLTVFDIDRARDDLVARGVDVSEVFHADLAEALRRAAGAHGEHEARTGRADPDWPDWYAEYIVRERAGEELPT